MTLKNFRVALLNKSLGRTVLPDDVALKERIFSGLKMIAKETIPLRLLVTGIENNSVIRRVDEELFIRFPEKPTDEELEVDIDEELIDALAFLVMSNLERAHKKQHIGDYLREIDMNNDRLMETYLSDSTNESDKMQPYA